MVRKTEDTTVRSMLVAMVERCPSGAITYSIDGGETENEPRLRSEIGVMANGPLWVTGGIPIDVGDQGTLESRNRVALCRCGASSRKPLCDGAHKWSVSWTTAGARLSSTKELGPTGGSA